MLVFVAGAGLMCAELVGGMTIAPYFGSNVYVWGSVISVFMAALSLGYVLGGRLADRSRRTGALAILAAAAGLLVIAVPLICEPISTGLLRADLGLFLNTLRPLAALVLIYFLPTMCFGMILPIAVRIASTTLGTVGRVVGRLYALNALGSVVGALGTMFLLVPFFGNRAILFGCGAAMVVAAAACAVQQRRGAVRAAEPPCEEGAESADAQPVAGLRPLVFTCGLVFMGLEVVGGAEIAPYLGSSIFVWGSVITLFLVALSVGYRLGGLLADRRPTMMTLATIVVAAGIATLLIPLLVPTVCSAVAGISFAGRFNLVVQALIACAALYLVPTVLFAMVAPFAVRLSTRDVSGVGGVAGKLYALSTFGNVAGVLLTTFVLIATVGKTRLLEGAGVLAVVVAVVAAFLHSRAEQKPPPVIVSAALVVVTLLFAILPKPPLVPVVAGESEAVGTVEAVESGRWLVVEATVPAADGTKVKRHYLRRLRAERESPYHHIAIIEQAAITPDVLGDTVLRGDILTTVDGRKMTVKPAAHVGNKRDLRFDQYVESSFELDAAAKALRKPLRAGTTYSDLLHLPFLFDTEIRDVLVIGGGGGVVPTIFARAYPDVTVDVVEIDPVVVDVATNWFKLTPSDRLRVHVQDGRMFVHNTPKKFDLIILDAYTAGGRIPFHLTTREFLLDVRSRVRPNGVVLMNVISALRGPSSRLFRSEYKTFEDVFKRERGEYVYVFPKRSLKNLPEVSTNVILIATGPEYGARHNRQEMTDRARERVDSGLVRMPTLKGSDGYAANMLTASELEDVPQDDVPILTDDYAPVDLMVLD